MTLSVSEYGSYEHVGYMNNDYFLVSAHLINASTLSLYLSNEHQNNFYERQRNLHKTESATQTMSSDRQSTESPTGRHEFWRLWIFLLLRQPDAKKYNRIMSMIIVQHLTQKRNLFFNDLLSSLSNKSVLKAKLWYVFKIICFEENVLCFASSRC